MVSSGWRKYFNSLPFKLLQDHKINLEKAVISKRQLVISKVATFEGAKGKLLMALALTHTIPYNKKRSKNSIARTRKSA